MRYRVLHTKLLVVAVLSAIFSTTPSNILAQNRKGQIFYSKSEGLYWVAIETSYFRAYVAQQHNTNWCWAVCTQMVLNYQGVSVSQEQIVERIYGSLIDQGGTIYLDSLSDVIDQVGRVSIVRTGAQQGEV